MITIVAAIITTVLTATFTIAWDSYRRRRGTKVRVKLIYQDQQPQTSIQYKRQKFEISYKGEPVENAILSLLTFENTGDTIKEPVTIEIYVTPRDENDTIEFIAPNIKDPLNKTTLDYEGTAKAPIIRFSRPFFNSRISQVKEIVFLPLWSNVELKFEVKGGGLGWYAEYYDMTPKPPTYAQSVFACSFWTGLLFVAIYVLIVSFRALIPYVSQATAGGWQSLLSGIGFGILAGGILGLILSQIRKIRSYMSRRQHPTPYESK
jgi:hypothetical protein